MMAGAAVLLSVADWRDEDWKTLLDEGADLWRRPKKGARSEDETPRERLQIEIGFGAEDDE